MKRVIGGERSLSPYVGCISRALGICACVCDDADDSALVCVALVFRAPFYWKVWCSNVCQPIGQYRLTRPRRVCWFSQARRWMEGGFGGEQRSFVFLCCVSFFACYSLFFFRNEGNALFLFREVVIYQFGVMSTFSCCAVWSFIHSVRYRGQVLVNRCFPTNQIWWIRRPGA